jgi:hypothetical protein
MNLQKIEGELKKRISYPYVWGITLIRLSI